MPKTTRFIYDRGNPEHNRLIGVSKSFLHVTREVARVRGLDQYTQRFAPYPGALVTCSVIFGSEHVKIETGVKLPEMPIDDVICFGNASCALAYVVSVVGIDIDPTGTEVEGICGTPIPYGFEYPEYYYCSTGLLYNVAVCGIDKGLYYYKENVASSDFMPRCPGSQVIVAVTQTTSMPVDYLRTVKTSPWAGIQFIKRPWITSEMITIMPHSVRLPRRKVVKKI